jgi:protein-L-isoaspartate(D-aspartate) O-methyltransferase
MFFRTVALSKMMDDEGTVLGIEHIPDLYKKGIENVSKSNKKLLEDGKIILKEGDGREGVTDYAPYNCIHVGAASEKVPKALVDQLKPGGRLMIPVGKYNQFIYLIDKDAEGKITKEAVLTVRFVPLTDKEMQLARSETNIYGFYEL